MLAVLYDFAPPSYLSSRHDLLSQEVETGNVRVAPSDQGTAAPGLDVVASFHLVCNHIDNRAGWSEVAYGVAGELEYEVVEVRVEGWLMAGVAGSGAASLIVVNSPRYLLLEEIFFCESCGWRE